MAIVFDMTKNDAPEVQAEDDVWDMKDWTLVPNIWLVVKPKAWQIVNEDGTYNTKGAQPSEKPSENEKINENNNENNNDENNTEKEKPEGIVDNIEALVVGTVNPFAGLMEEMSTSSWQRPQNAYRGSDWRRRVSSEQWQNSWSGNAWRR